MPPENAEDKRDRDYNDVFGSPAGERVLRDLMGQFQMYQTSHAAGDSHQTAFHEGERNVILHVLARLQKHELSAREITDAATRAARSDYLER